MGIRLSKLWQGVIGPVLIGLIVLIFLFQAYNMSWNIWASSIATGVCLAPIALGVYISFRILNFPDMTIEGSFTLGASIAAVLIASGVDPFLTLPLGFVGGALAGIVTALIANRLKIHSLLASILTTTALLSINLRVMGRSNIPLLDEETIFLPFSEPFNRLLQQFLNAEMLKSSNYLLAILMAGGVALALKLLLDWFMQTEVGLAMQATGANPQMIRSLGANTDHVIILGLAISNGLVGFSGALFTQYQGFADVNMGQGLIIAGLAAVIVGETIFRPQRIAFATTAVVCGMIIYRVAIAAALNIRFPMPGGEVFRLEAQDIKIATAAIVLLALWLTTMQKKRKQMVVKPC